MLLGILLLVSLAAATPLHLSSSAAHPSSISASKGTSTSSKKFTSPAPSTGTKYSSLRHGTTSTTSAAVHSTSSSSSASSKRSVTPSDGHSPNNPKSVFNPKGSSTHPPSTIRTKTTTTTTKKPKPKPTSTPTTPPLQGISNNVLLTCVTPGQFAYTIDDGPYVYGGGMADLLVEHGGLGTFFVNGLNDGCIYDYAEELQRRYLAGHQIAAHTWSHPDITRIQDPEFLVREFQELETALLKIIGVKPLFFRAPYGAVNQPLVDTITSWGYQVVKWNMDSGDSQGLSADASIALFQTAVDQFPTPWIAISHETHYNTGTNIAPVVIPMIRNAGYKFVTIAECLGMEAYSRKGGPMGVRDASWTCAGTLSPADNP